MGLWTRSCGAWIRRLCGRTGVRRGRRKKDEGEPPDHALGRSRGGFSTKIHVVCDGTGVPLHVEVTGGQVSEAQAFPKVYDGAEASLTDENGEPIARPQKLASDEAYRSDAIDQFLLSRDVTPVIPSRSGQCRSRRPVAFDRDAYRRRNVVERLVGRLKEFRRVAIRYEKNAVHFKAMIMLAMIVICLRLLTG